MADLKSGTHIEVKLDGCSYHGIYVGNGFVVYLEETTDSLNSNEIKKSSIKDFMRGTSTLYKIQYPKSVIRYTGEEIAERALALLRGGNNSFVKKSSENFTVWCTTGIKSHQMLDQIRTTIKAIKLSRKIVEYLREQEFIDLHIESLDSFDSLVDVILDVTSSIPVDQVVIGAVGATSVVTNGVSSVATGITTAVSNTASSVTTVLNGASNTSIPSLVTAVSSGSISALPVVGAIGASGAVIGGLGVAAGAGVGALAVAAAPLLVPVAIGAALAALVKGSRNNSDNKKVTHDEDD